jgi:hypothetical protein
LKYRSVLEEKCVWCVQSCATFRGDNLKSLLARDVATCTLIQTSTQNRPIAGIDMPLGIQVFETPRIPRYTKVSALSTGCFYPPPPPEIFLVLVSVRGSVDPHGHSVARRMKSVKNSNDTIGNRTRDLLACSVVPRPPAPLRDPLNRCSHLITKR